jgi:hypothetical protein
MRLALGLALLACAACARESALPAGAPEQALIDAFDAVAAADCPRFEAAVSDEIRGRMAERGCEASLRGMRDSLRLVSVLEVATDGRDERVRLIRATVDIGGKLREKSFRVEPRRGRWVLMTL